MQGELYRVDLQLLNELDEFEGHPDLYWRTQLELVDRRTVEAYVMPSDRLRGGREIPSGDWRLRETPPDEPGGKGED